MLMELRIFRHKNSNEKLYTCNQQSVQETLSKKIILIKLFTAILVCRINLHLLIQYSEKIFLKERLQSIIPMRFHTSLSPTITMGNYHCARVNKLSQDCFIWLISKLFFWFLCYNAIVLLSCRHYCLLIKKGCFFGFGTICLRIWYPHA